MTMSRPAPITLDLHFSDLRAVTLSHTGRFAGLYGQMPAAYYVVIIDIYTQNEISRINLGESAPLAVRFTADESAVVVGIRRHDGSLAVVRYLVSVPASPDLRLEQADGRGMAISRDGQRVVFRTSSGLTVFDLKDQHGIDLRESEPVSRVAISAEGTLVALARDDRLAVYRVGQRRPAESLGPLGEFPIRHVLTMDCSEDTVVAVSRDEPVVSVVYGPERGPVYAEAGITRIAISRAGTMVAVGSRLKISLVDLHSKLNLAALPVLSPVRRLTFSLDDRLLGTAHDDNVARIWNLADFLPDQAEALLERARSAQVGGSVDEAMEKYRQAAEAGSVPAMRELGHLLEQASARDAEALAAYRRALDAGDKSALRDFGRVNEKLGHFDEAVESYELAVAAGDIAAARDLARIADRDGREADARRWFRRWAEDRASQLSTASRDALSYADGLRLYVRRSRIYMEHLLLGLASQPGGPAQRLLAGAGMDRADLVSLLSDLLTSPVSAEVAAGSGTLPDSVPPVSDHAGDAIDNAVLLAQAAGIGGRGAGALPRSGGSRGSAAPSRPSQACARRCSRGRGTGQRGSRTHRAGAC
jgi:hypothetical protein